MSAGAGPQIFVLRRDKLVAMMEANFASLEKVVDDIDKAIDSGVNPMTNHPLDENTKASLQRWRQKFATDAIETSIMLSHIDDTKAYHLTGTQLIGIYRTFRTVEAKLSWLAFNPPPPDGERAEHRLANTAAAVPRSFMPTGVDLNWTPQTPGLVLLQKPGEIIQP